VNSVPLAPGQEASSDSKPHAPAVDPLHPDGYKMGALSRLSGLSPELIRAWQRRHGLFEPRRTGGRHRMFTRDDLDVALWAGRQVAEGRAVSELAALGRAEILRRIHPPERAGGRLEPSSPGARVVRGKGGPTPMREQAPQAPIRRALGTQAGSQGPPEPRDAKEPLDFSAELLRAAERVDEAAARHWVRRAQATFAPDVVLGGVLRPALVEIGLGWSNGTVSVAGEHAVAGAIRTSILLLLEDGARDGRGPPVVLACGPGELHEIPALLHGWELHRQGVVPRWFGADLPVAELAGACRAVGAAAAHLSFSRWETYRQARPALLDCAVGHTGRFSLHVGGTGVPAADAELSHAGVILGR
jgi:hypothetical protein